MRRRVDVKPLIHVAVFGSVALLGALRAMPYILEPSDEPRAPLVAVDREGIVETATSSEPVPSVAKPPPASPVDVDRKPKVLSKPRPSPVEESRKPEEDSMAADPIAEVVNRLNVLYDREAPDPAWAGKAQTRITERFAAAIESPTDITTNCKKTLCRITLQFADDLGRDAAVGALSLPWDGQGIFQTDPNNELKVVMYAAREGYTLPE